MVRGLIAETMVRARISSPSSRTTPITWSFATSSAATRAPVRMVDALRRDRLRHRLGDGAHAALRQREAGGLAGGLAGEAV